MRSLPDLREIWKPEDARRVLEEWKQSGGPLSEFARRYGIDPARLYWWRKRLANESPSVTALALVPATITSAASSAITVRLPNEIAIELTSATPQEVAALVAELTRSMS
jgi:transposase-like protein